MTVIIVSTKICTKCDKGYPATLKYFSPNKRRKDGLQSRCKKCYKKCTRKYRQTFIGRLRSRFHAMKDRCTNPKHKSYKYYGGRGIKCLFKNADEFVDYVIDELQIDPRELQTDRIDNNGNYEPGNIRFVTAKENSNNRRKRKCQEN